MPEQIPDEALDLHESISLVEAADGSGPFNDDGTVTIHIIRPGIGKGRGRHLYEANMLQENAHKFNGWRMYVDHLSPEARKAAGGLPRSIRDLGGRITESKWDPSVPADKDRGYGGGAVVGKAKPVPFMRDLIENDPELVEASISASATSVRPIVKDGQKVWCVEGINDRGSVDWVTEAGAGGRVAPLVEAAYATEEDMDRALLESMSADEFRAFVTKERPELLQAVQVPVAVGSTGATFVTGTGTASNSAGTVTVTPTSTTLAEAENDNEGEDMPITPEALQEALASSPQLIVDAVAKSPEMQELLNGLVEAKIEAERDTIRAEARADANRSNQLRDLRDEAHALIAESRLPDSWQKDLQNKFRLDEGRPTEALDVLDEHDEFGNVTKTAAVTLREAVQTEIERERERLREVSPTRVRGMSPRPEDVEEADKKKQPEAEKPLWKTVLQEAGVDPDKAFAR